MKYFKPGSAGCIFPFRVHAHKNQDILTVVVSWFYFAIKYKTYLRAAKKKPQAQNLQFLLPSYHYNSPLLFHLLSKKSCCRLRELHLDLVHLVARFR